MNKRKYSEQVFTIGISGKIGSGKSTLATALQKEFAAKPDWIVFERNFADKLKELFAFFYKIEIQHCYSQEGKNLLLPIKNMTHEDLKTLVAFHFGYSEKAFEKNTFLNSRYGTHVTLNDMLKRWENLHLEQYSQMAMTIGQALQKWGTALREVDSELWIKAVADYIDSKKLENDATENKKLLFIIPDVRFPNEASWIRSEMQGSLVRLNGDPGSVAKNSKRDLTHISETALDEYKLFDTVLDTNKQPTERCVNAVLKLILE